MKDEYTTGKSSVHHHEGTHGGANDEGAHESHRKMNKRHGTPKGFGAGKEYGAHEMDKGLSHGGEGGMGNMAKNEECY